MSGFIYIYIYIYINIQSITPLFQMNGQRLGKAIVTRVSQEKMNTKLPCPYCSSLDGFIYVQSHYQCSTCKRVVDDCCGGETMDCMVPMDTSCTPTQTDRD